MKSDVLVTQRMSVACSKMIENIKKLDYILAHRMENDKVYQDILKDLEFSLCTLEARVGEMRSDETAEDKGTKYRNLLAEKEQEKCKRLYLAEHVKTINGILKDTSSIIDNIPEKFLRKE